VHRHKLKLAGKACRSNGFGTVGDKMASDPLEVALMSASHLPQIVERATSKAKSWRRRAAALQFNGKPPPSARGSSTHIDIRDDLSRRDHAPRDAMSPVAAQHVDAIRAATLIEADMPPHDDDVAGLRGRSTGPVMHRAPDAQARQWAAASMTQNERYEGSAPLDAKTSGVARSEPAASFRDDGRLRVGGRDQKKQRKNVFRHGRDVRGAIVRVHGLFGLLR